VVSLDEVIKECKKYNKFAQKILYEKYAPAMKGICLRYIGDPDSVKDIVQDAFIKVFSNIRQYSGNGSFDGWIKRIFINTAISYLRKYPKDQKHVKLEDIEGTGAFEETSGLFEPEIENKTGVEISKQNSFEVVLSADFSEAELLGILERLPAKYRVVFNLYCLENFKHEEIAQILNIDIATSRTRLMRARQYIQKELYELSIIRLSI